MPTHDKHPNSLRPAGHLIKGLAGALILVGCTSAPPAPTDAIQAAERAISQAEDVRAAEFAPGDLSAARDKLTAARELSQEAVHKKDRKRLMQARWMAEEAQSAAELATARANQAKAEGVNKEMQRTIDSLQQEMQRGSGSMQ